MIVELNNDVLHIQQKMRKQQAQSPEILDKVEDDIEDNIEKTGGYIKIS